MFFPGFSTGVLISSLLATPLAWRCLTAHVFRLVDNQRRNDDLDFKTPGAAPACGETPEFVRSLLRFRGSGEGAEAERLSCSGRGVAQPG
jgi:hypothetical protein